MKTGFDTTDNTIDDTIIQTGNELLNRLMVYAIKNACTYAKSAGRNNMSGQDIIIALQYEAHEFPYRNCNFESESEDESTDSSDEAESADENDDIFTVSTSNDELIQKMNYYNETWEMWIPETPIQITLKNAVNKAKTQYT